jgi:hypothetical protein
MSKHEAKPVLAFYTTVVSILPPVPRERFPLVPE